MNLIKIWQPRYHDNVCLIGKHKVKAGDNIIVFTKAKYLKDKQFKLTDSQIKSFPLDSNGTIACYAVDMDLLKESEIPQ
jgi:hypothetical protein